MVPRRRRRTFCSYFQVERIQTRSFSKAEGSLGGSTRGIHALSLWGPSAEGVVFSWEVRSVGFTYRTMTSSFSRLCERRKWKNLKLWLHSYYKHVHDNPDALTQVFRPLQHQSNRKCAKSSLHRDGKSFASNHEINRTFDLKGSMHGRFTKADDAKPNAVYKDLIYLPYSAWKRVRAKN